MPYRIFVVDDHPVMLDAYVDVIAHEPDLESCGTAASAEEAMEALTVSGSNPDCDLVVADYRMPGLSGAELVRRLKAVRPDLLSVVVSAHEDAAVAREAMEAGASAFVRKRELMDTLVPTIRAVLDERRRDAA